MCFHIHIGEETPHLGFLALLRQVVHHPPIENHDLSKILRNKLIQIVAFFNYIYIYIYTL